MAKCHLCANPATDRFKPFCSKRCADLDLGQWLKGGYAIPGAPVDPSSPSNSTQKDEDED